MRKPPSFQFYADDFLGGVATFSLEQRGLYITMLCIQWNVGHVSDEDWEHYGTANGSAMAQPMANGMAKDGSPSPSPYKTERVRAHEEQSEPDRQNLPTELPANFPASPDEAQVAAAIVGCPEEFARETWNKAMSRLGRDAKDVPIRSWRHYLAAEWKFEQNRKAEKVERSRRSGQRVQTSTPDHEAGF